MIAMYERTRKESHLDTIWYEIDILGHCFSVLVNDPPLTTDLHWNLPVETEKEGNADASAMCAALNVKNLRKQSQ
jgi:hypothetical protein